MSFSCPHFDPNNDWCDRVHDRCVCGRPGCVLAKNSVFAIAPALRLADTGQACPQSPPSAPPAPQADPPPYQPPCA